MLTQLLLGMAIFISNVIIETLTVGAVVLLLVRIFSRTRIGTSRLREGLSLATTMLMMFLGHLVQIAIWAFVFKAIGEFDGFAAAFYHSTVNFSTLGYGDLVMSDQWRLLGALEAGTGVMMFGVSTAVFFAMLAKIIERRLGRRWHEIHSAGR